MQTLSRSRPPYRNLKTLVTPGRSSKRCVDPLFNTGVRLPLEPRAALLVLFFILNREDFSFVIHLDRQPRTSRRREAQTGSRARSGSRSERTLDAVEHSRTLMEWWPFLIFHRGGLRIKVINNTWSSRALHVGLITTSRPSSRAVDLTNTASNDANHDLVLAEAHARVEGHCPGGPFPWCSGR